MTPLTPPKTAESENSPALTEDGNGGLIPQEQSLVQRQHEVTRREETMHLWELTRSTVEADSGDLREANEHLVMATLAAGELEEATQKSKRQQDEFLAMLAHELRNPLAPIRSAAALLERLDTVDPRLTTISEVIHRQVEHMARLLDDLLDASRVTSGRVTLQRKTTKVGDFVDQAVEMYRGLTDAQHQHLTLDMPVSPMYVDGDPARLAQIIGNLLHNAAKYTPQGGAIALSARPERDTVVIRVTDNGSGIAAETLPHIFDLFAQEERSLSRSQGGLGIGLTVVRSMVERHGGTVQARSAGLGAGSEFTVILPRVEKIDEPALAPVPALKPAFVSARILLVDDNVDAGVLLRMLLEMSGYEVEVALDGVGALDAFENQRSQIVVCDIGLPGMNGYEVAKRLRQRCAGSESSPLLIALTGYESPEDHKRALAAGFDHHVAKPVDFEVLLRLIEKAVVSPGVL
ncbi:hybrid sensor histidine kinase/response regulator [Variovorax sp. PBL-E5]|uniref:hybrid sensor histidine kinase/response regulator n=1 Tax=Variovorax sp. PBL-E5 TaxID=434014 RepID=UPI0013184801|nr:ATP-binding protein [Variovorax sp. PBL-E5]VTU39775.1 Autoinducer 2 sensor kinase/phosphatase LuxQ [Variovorax sp. PBL-E5]